MAGSRRAAVDPFVAARAFLVDCGALLMGAVRWPRLYVAWDTARRGVAWLPELYDDEVYAGYGLHGVGRW